MAQSHTLYGHLRLVDDIELDRSIQCAYRRVVLIRCVLDLRGRSDDGIVPLGAGGHDAVFISLILLFFFQKMGLLRDGGRAGVC